MKTAGRVGHQSHLASKSTRGLGDLLFNIPSLSLRGCAQQDNLKTFGCLVSLCDDKDRLIPETVHVCCNELQISTNSAQNIFKCNFLRF
jgi:hypothetical protein